MKKLSKPNYSIQDNTGLNPSKALVLPDVSKGKMLLQEPTEDSKKMMLFPHVPSKHVLSPNVDLLKTVLAEIIVSESGNICLTLWSEQPSRLLWTEPGSTIPKLPPRTKEERLSMLGDEAEEIIGDLDAEKYIDALRRLDSLNDSLRNTILSGALPDEISENVNNVLESLESCKQVIYNGIKEGNAAETIQQHKLMPILEGFGKILKAYANLDEWKEKMAAEWGGNRG